jgi:Transcriptional regulator, AbiEi antitoxin, Type IV TA system
MIGVEKLAQEILAANIDGATVLPSVEKNNKVPIRLHEGPSVTFEIRWAGQGWPQDVRSAAADVPEPWPNDVVLLAHRLSTGAIEWLRARGANWADEAGQARILGPGGLTVIREPARQAAPDPHIPAFAWSKSTLATAEAILAREDPMVRATELASITGWSVPQTANVLKAFDRQGWTTKRGAARGRGAHRELIDPTALLAAWSSAIAEDPYSTRIAHRATKDVMALLRNELAPALERSVSWAVSGWAGLELTAPFATTTPSLHVYVARDDFGGSLNHVIEAAGLQEVEEGGRVIFWAAEPSVLTLSWRAHGIPTVSPPRLYADLSSLGARGQDAADHVREQLIDPLHLSRVSRDEIAHG